MSLKLLSVRAKHFRVKSMASKSISNLPKPVRSKSETNDSEANDKSRQILHAAQSLFVRYGIKRTSIDDIAREAGIAKGTLYLYYDSKDALFASVAERMCIEILDNVHKAIVSPVSLNEQLLELLDANVGFMHRLLEESPHMAELTETKETLAASIFATFDSQFKNLLRTHLSDNEIVREDVAEMFLAAAYGVIRTGDTSKEHYRIRLAVLIDTLLMGLRCNETK